MRGLAVLAAIAFAAAASAEVVGIHDLSPAEIGSLQRDHDFWGIDPATGAAVFDVTPVQRDRLEAAGYAVSGDPVRQRRLDDWRAAAPRRMLGRTTDTIPGFACYRSVDRTHADLQALAEAHPRRARWIEIGTSWQSDAGSAGGDSLFVLALADSRSPHPKPPLVIVASQHARELVTAEIATRFAERLLVNPDDDPDIDWLLEHRSVHIIAQANPDGRREVEQGQSLWRKNHNESACAAGNLTTTWPGVDLNRNGSFLWAPVDSPCGQRYAGPVLASEPETRAIETYLTEVFERQRPAADLVTPAPDTAEGVLLSLHSFGELLLIPWEGLGGQNENNAPNHEALTLLGRRFGEATGYAVARWSLLPPATGTLVDHAYGEYGAAAYTFEFGTDFLESCEAFEATIWPAALESLLLAARAARRPYREPNGPAVLDVDWRADGGNVVVTGSADDGLYFSGGVQEPPWPTPVQDVVTIEITVDGPPETGKPGWRFAVPTPASRVGFDIELPPLAGDVRLFVTAVDASGQRGLPRVVAVRDLILADGFESP